jgi:hypothetical protein
VRFEGVVVVQKVEELTCACNEGKPSVAIRGHQRQLSSLRRRRDSDSPRAPPRYKGDRGRYRGDTRRDSPRAPPRYKGDRGRYRGDTRRDSPRACLAASLRALPRYTGDTSRISRQRPLRNSSHPLTCGHRAPWGALECRVATTSQLGPSTHLVEGLNCLTACNHRGNQQPIVDSPRRGPQLPRGLSSRRRRRDPRTEPPAESACAASGALA